MIIENAISDFKHLTEKTMTELQREVVDEWLKVSAGIKNLEKIEKRALAKLKKICEERDLEIVRERYLEGLEIILTELKKERGNFCRTREKIKHISRKILLEELERFAADLEDGVELSEQQERDRVKALADETMENQREIGRVTIRMIGDIDAHILDLENTKALCTFSQQFQW